jgi:hypothetical protein
MGFLDRAVKRAVGNAVGNAVGSAVERAVAPKIEQGVQRTAQQILPQQQPMSPQLQQPPAIAPQQPQQATAALGGLFGGLNSFANQLAQDKKICPGCGAMADGNVKFCPSCGAKLPEQTMGQGAVCTACGKQNGVGTKFCADCGAKLPAALAQEQAAQEKDAQVLAQWAVLLPQYPQWQCGGYHFELECDGGSDLSCTRFSVYGAGRAQLEQYRQLLLQSGFRPASESPDPCQLYARVNGMVYNVDTEHAFEGDALDIYFAQREPRGGFDYVKPQPQPKQSGLGGLLDLLK